MSAFDMSPIDILVAEFIDPDQLLKDEVITQQEAAILCCHFNLPFPDGIDPTKVDEEYHHKVGEIVRKVRQHPKRYGEKS